MSHVRSVKILYKRILKLHYNLPPDLKAIGDRYAKDEFKHHKTAEPKFVAPFLIQWKEYADLLEAQIAKSFSQGDTLNPKVGASIPEELLEKDFKSEQVVQLHELMKETSKPSTQFNIKEEK